MTFKKIRKIALWSLAVLVLLVFSVVAVAYAKQDELVSELISKLNEDFKGKVELEDSHISLFQNFPYISIDLEEIKVFENKIAHSTPILHIHDTYVGFNIFSILTGDMTIKKVKLENGFIKMIQYRDGTFNIAEALSSTKEVESVEEEFHLDLNKIELVNVDISKLNEENNVLVDVFVDHADTKFKSVNGDIYTGLDAAFQCNLIIDGDTTFVKHKHFLVDTDLDFIGATQTLTIHPSDIQLEDSFFAMKGALSFQKDIEVDFTFEGNKPNFDLFIAMAPEELIPTLKKYDNEGKIFFKADIKGLASGGQSPAIDVKFGCEKAFVNNFRTDKKIDDLNFLGYFTNGEKHSPETMEFGIQNFSAKPEAGIFSGNLVVKNFESPDINLQLNSDFDLNFLAKFLELEDMSDLQGKVELSMNFRDIIDLDSPEKSIEKLNESYFTELKIENLSFLKGNVDIPIKDIDVYAQLIGNEAKIEYLDVVAGNSDIHLSGSISDLPAVLHHTDKQVTASLQLNSKYLDLFELTGADSIKSVNEQIENFSVKTIFTSSAKSLTESPNLPIGEFFIENLYAKMKHYPHTLHDFHADVFIEKEDFRVIDFKGLIDQSDFFFSGKLKHYDLWFQDQPAGDTRVEFDWTSSKLQLHDLFSYKGENFVPEDYRHEEFDNLKFHGIADLHFKDGLKSIDLDLDHFGAKMKLHHQKVENFNGRIHYEEDNLMVENFAGRIGTSDFKTSLHYYLGEDETMKKRKNHFELFSNRLNFDELFYSEKEVVSSENSKQSIESSHDAGFNIYELPFTDMTFDIKIGHLNYHNYKIDNIDWKLRTTPNHYLYLDKAHLEAADGSWDLKGYFNGSNPDAIYFKPDITIHNVVLDKLFLKFDNFGQDHLVSENLHGKLSGSLSGVIRMHKDLVPIIDKSDLDMALEVVDGRLENFEMLEAMSEYFGDKNVRKVLFDTLSNELTLRQGKLNISDMTINSSLGFMQISGTQDMELNMDYFVRVPWKMVTEAASSKLFKGRKKEEVDAEQVDEIQYADASGKTRYVNIRIKGNPDDFKVSLEKRK